MKFVYQCTVFFVLLFVSAACVAAPMSGVYTIGGSSPNFSTFGAAVADLHTNGVNGPVTFNVRPGTYNETITINAITGATSANHITFQAENGVASSVVITYNTSTVVLNAAKYITFKNVSINATQNIQNTTKAFVLQNGCNYDSILNCRLSCPIAPWTDYTFVIYASQGTNDNIVVDGSYIDGAGFGYEVEGGGTNFGPYLTNNRWSNQTYMAINIMGCKNSILEGNIINSCIAGSRFGIIVWQGCNNVKVLNNVIYGVYAQGMYIPSPQGGLIANNFIQADWGIYGITSAGWQIYNNNFRCNTAIYMSSTGAGNDLKNNIFYSHNGGTLLTLDNFANFNFDYNAYYTTGRVATVNSVNYTTLANWQSASSQDANSRTVMPNYVSTVDLHLTGFTGFNFGTPLGVVSNDVDYTPRTVSPMVGADDSGARVITLPSLYCCTCPQPEVEFIASPTTLCEADTVKFTDQSGTGAGNWVWTFDGGTPSTSNLQNPTVVYHTAGTYNVKLVATTQAGLDSLTRNAYITVNPGPNAGTLTSTDASICMGDSALLSVAGSSGTLTWQASANGISYTDIAGTSATTYNANALLQTTYFRVKANSACGLDSTAALQQVVVPLPAPVVSATDSVFCSNDSVQVCATGASAYQWNTGATTSCIYAKSAGGYWVTATGDSGCVAVSGNTYLSVHPVSSVSIVLQGDTLSSFGAITYQWYRDGVLIPGATSPLYIAPVSGDYTVQITDINGCRVLSSAVPVDVVGIQDVLPGTDIVVYPNPFTHSVYIEGKNISGVGVYDMVGRTVYNHSYDIPGPPAQVDLSTLPAGMYYLKIQVGDKWFYKQLTKQ